MVDWIYIIKNNKDMIKIGKDISGWGGYSCQPTTKYELRKIIKDRIVKESYNCDLNDIDVSQIMDMSYLFFDSFFNCDISKWDVSNVNNMSMMFAYSKFNRDISDWNIRKDCYVENMFTGCQIKEEFKPKLPR